MLLRLKIKVSLRHYLHTNMLILYSLIQNSWALSCPISIYLYPWEKSVETILLFTDCTQYYNKLCRCSYQYENPSSEYNIHITRRNRILSRNENSIGVESPGKYRICEVLTSSVRLYFMCVNDNGNFL